MFSSVLVQHSRFGQNSRCVDCFVMYCCAESSRTLDQCFVVEIRHGKMKENEGNSQRGLQMHVQIAGSPGEDSRPERVGRQAPCTSSGNKERV